MLAVRLHGAGDPLSLEQLPIPEPTDLEVRVRVAACGVCRTDLHIADGLQARVELPLTLGHEIAGHVDEAGKAARVRLAEAGIALGDPVLVFGGWGCGECGDCLAGEEQRCARGRSPGFQVDGGYAEHVRVPDPRHLVPLGDLDPVRAAPLADAGLTAYRAVRRAAAWLRPGASALVVGAGGLGQFAIQHLRRAEPDLTIVVRDPDRARRQRARRLGASVVLDAEAPLPPELRRVDVVLDLVGTDQTLAESAASVAPGGLVCLVGEGGGRLPFGFDTLPVEVTLTTVAWGSASELAAVVALARDGKLEWEVEPLPLPQAQAAHERLRRDPPPGRLVLVP